MIPRSCAYSSASAICLAIGNASSIGIGPCLIRSASVGPSTSSITRACVLPTVLETVDRGDVGVVQRGEDLGFAPEAGHPVTVERERFGQDLHRDVATQLRIPRAIDLAHASRAKQGHDLIRAKPSAGSEGHRKWLGL